MIDAVRTAHDNQGDRSLIGKVSDLRKLNVRRIIVTAPLVLPVLGFCAGVACDGLVRPSVCWPIALALIAILVLAILWSRPVGRITCVFALALSAGTLHHAAAMRFLPADHITRQVDRPHRNVTLSGTILSAPTTRWLEKTYPYHTRPSVFTYFLVKADRLNTGGETVDTSGLVRVTMSGIHDQYRPGMDVAINGTLSIPPTSIDPTAVRMTVHSPGDITIHRAARGPRLVRDQLRRFARALLAGDGQHIGPETHSLLSAIVLGQRGRVERNLNRAFLRAGAAHFLAVSGFHLAVLASAVWFITAAMGLSRRMSAAVILVVVWLFVLVNETRPPIVRAAIMATLACLAVLTRRQLSSLNWLAAAAFLILLVNPAQLFNTGFQLSFVCVAGIVLLYRPIYRTVFGRPIWPMLDRLDPRTLRGKGQLVAHQIGRCARLGLIVSLAAYAASLPIVMSRFGIVSLAAPITSLLVYPLAAMLIVTGFFQLVLSAILGSAGALSGLTAAIAAALAATVRLISQLPGVRCSVLPPPAIWTAAYYALLACVALGATDDSDDLDTPPTPVRLALHRLIRPTAKKNVALLLIASYLTYWLIAAGAVPPRSKVACDVLIATRFDGHSLAVRLADDLLIFDGGANRVNDAADLINTLQTNHLSNLRAVFLTFPEQRFFNDLPTIAQTTGHVDVYTSQAFTELADYYEPASHLFEQGIVTDASILKPGTTVSVGSCQVKLLYPGKTVVSTLLQLNPPNRNLRGSALLRHHRELGAAYLLTTGNHRILIASVLGPLACDTIRHAYPQLRADTVVVYALSPVGHAHQALLQHLQIDTLIVCGRPSEKAKRWYERICRTNSARLIVTDNDYYLHTIAEN